MDKGKSKKERDDLIGVSNLNEGMELPEEREVTVRNSIKSKVLFIFFLVLTGAISGFGLSFFAQAYTSVISTKTIDGKWDIAFTDMKLTEKKGRAVELSEPYFEDTRASFNVALNEPGDEIVYTFRIANRGNIDAILSDIIISPENTENDDILYYVTDISKYDYLDVRTSTTMKVVIKYNENSPGKELKSKSAQIILNYVQKWKNP